VYQTEFAGTAQHTLIGWTVSDIDAAVRELAGKGVSFEPYDMPDFKTDEAGIADMGGERAAWFKDPEGNLLSPGSPAIEAVWCQGSGVGDQEVGPEAPPAIERAAPNRTGDPLGENAASCAITRVSEASTYRLMTSTGVELLFPLSSRSRRSSPSSASLAARAAVSVTKISPAPAAEASRAATLTGSPRAVSSKTSMEARWAAVKHKAENILQHRLRCSP
jgi:hypothetical protein